VGVTFKRAAKYSPASDEYQFQTYSIYLYDDAEAFGRGLTNAAGTRARSEVLLYIHGYNTPFEDGIYRTAQLVVETDFHGVPIYFGWPAGEHWWEYPAAVDRVATAATDLGLLLKVLIATPSISALHVVAHSLGNRVLTQALDRLSTDPEFQVAVIANLVMAAPDVNRSQFEMTTGAIVRASRKRTVYVSNTDWALRVSGMMSSERRVGQRTPLGVGPEFEAVDVTGIKDSIIGHSYLVDNDRVARDIGALVVRGLPAARRGLRSVLENGAIIWQMP
jgi:esterase/lipase superfamily enzyme